MEQLRSSVQTPVWPPLKNWNLLGRWLRLSRSRSSRINFRISFVSDLNQLIASRAAEHQITLVEAPKDSKVIDMMDALRRSLAEVKSVEKAAQAQPAQSNRQTINCHSEKATGSGSIDHQATWDGPRLSRL